MTFNNHLFITLGVISTLFAAGLSSAVFGSYDNNQRPQIENLSIVYATSVDKRDFNNLRDVFHEDAILEGPGFKFQGIEEIVAGMEGIRMYDKTQHFVMNQDLKIDNLSASNRVYTIAYHFFKKENVSFRLDWGIIYSDSLKREKGRWKILNRKLDLIWQKEERI